MSASGAIPLRGTYRQDGGGVDAHHPVPILIGTGQQDGEVMETLGKKNFVRIMRKLLSKMSVAK